MKKLFAIILLICLLALSGCGHEHIWKDADCVNPKSCECGETKGEALGHNWEEATCTSPKTCSRCNTTEGQEIGHSWNAATCIAPKMCASCSTIEGAPLGHTINEWSVQKEATCVENGVQQGTCASCGQIIDAQIETIDHIPGEWVITDQATATTQGIRTQSCTACGTVLKTEEFELSPEEAETEYKKACKSYTYEEIARNPGKYEGKLAVFTGKIIQVQQQNYYGIMCYVLRVNVTKTKYSYTDTIYVTYYATEDDARILEDDIIVMYGELNGEKTYTTVMGASVTIPYFTAEYIEIK